jgi:hypothetical protein
LQAVWEARRAVLYEEANSLVKPLGPTLARADYKLRLAEASATISLLDGLRRNDPAHTAQSLTKAHDALVAAVNDPARNYGNLVKAVGEFADRAAALRNALTAAAASTGADKSKAAATKKGD